MGVARSVNLTFGTKNHMHFKMWKLYKQFVKVVIHSLNITSI